MQVQVQWGGGLCLGGQWLIYCQNMILILKSWRIVDLHLLVLNRQFATFQAQTSQLLIIVYAIHPHVALKSFTSALLNLFKKGPMWKVTLVSVFCVSLGARLAEVERKTPESDAKELADVPTTESPEEANQEKYEVVVNFTKDAKPGVELGRGDRKGTMLREHEAGTIISQIEPGGFLADKGPRKNWHVVKIDKTDVSHFGPMTVQSLWVKAMHSHKPYTVIFDREIRDLEHRSVLYVGAFPALLALIVTCCALPPFLCSIWRGTALANPRPPEMEIDDGLEEAPQLARPCYLADAVDHPVTRYTLMFFFLFSLFDSIRLSIDFIFLRPLVAYIHISDAALVLSMSIVLEFGRRATQQNPLIFDPPESVSKDKAMTMSEKLVQRLPKLYKQKARYARCEAGLTEVMTKELKYGMYLCLPTVLMCFFVAGNGIVIIAIYIESRGFKGGMAVGAVVCSDICYFCLLRLCILKLSLAWVQVFLQCLVFVFLWYCHRKVWKSWLSFLGFWWD